MELFLVIILTFLLCLTDVCVPLNYLTCEKNGAIEMQHNNNNNGPGGGVTFGNRGENAFQSRTRRVGLSIYFLSTTHYSIEHDTIYVGDT